jgi:hypothetical protein
VQKSQFIAKTQSRLRTDLSRIPNNTAAGVNGDADGEILNTSSEVIHSDISFK